MARVLSPLAKRIFEMLPPYYEGEPFMEAIINALAREAERIEETASAIRREMFPQNATDRFKLLSLWEKLFTLPVAPTGVAESVRRQFVLARFRGRNSGAGSAWVEAMQQALGSTVWTYQEGPGAYQVTIYLSFSASSYNSVQVQQFARAITPAHIEVAVVYEEGFVVGEGLVGEDRL